MERCAVSVFINLPVRDLPASIAFYEAIGCTRNDRFSNASGAAMTWSDSVTFMLLTHDLYRSFTPKPIIDAHTTSGVLLAPSLDSRAAVDAFAAAAIATGGREVHGAEDEGFMYSRGVEDPDGHGFGPFWMDAAAMPTKTETAL